MKSADYRFHVTRRHFLRTSAALAAASSLPQWFLARDAQAATARLTENDRPGIALIGCGGMGRGDLKNASRFGKVVALCDVDDDRLAQTKRDWPEAATFKDFRKLLERDDIHAVICGTVDHWHTQISMAAALAGKDIYCEKPLTLTIDEGKRLVKTVKETGRVLQTGSQQRSDKNFRLACELVRNGRLGKLKHVEVWLPAGPRRGPFESSPVPAGLNWDQWLGQAPKVDYVKERCHGSFRYWLDYSGGTMTDWGAHHHDIALWGAGMDRSGPETITAKQVTTPIPGGFTAPAEYEVDYVYPNGVTQATRSTTGDTLSGGVADKEGQRHGVKFIGADGWIWVTRGQIQASAPELLTEPLAESATRLYTSNDHMGNFFECIRSRKAPICDAEIGHRSASVCHLGVIALQLGRKLKWDPKKEEFVGDAEANKFVAREMRKGWGYDYIA